MRKLRLASIFAVAASFAVIASLQSCTKVAEKLHFNLKMQTGSVKIVIPASNYTTGTATFGPSTTSYNVDSFITAQTGGALTSKNITSVKIASVKMTIDNATPDNNLRNLESVYASFSSNTYTTPFVVSVPFIPDNFATSIDIPVDSTAELKSYLGNQFNYSVTGKLRRPTTIDLHCTVEYAFNVEVNG